MLSVRDKFKLVDYLKERFSQLDITYAYDLRQNRICNFVDAKSNAIHLGLINHIINYYDATSTQPTEQMVDNFIEEIVLSKILDTTQTADFLETVSFVEPLYIQSGLTSDVVNEKFESVVFLKGKTLDNCIYTIKHNHFDNSVEEKRISLIETFSRYGRRQDGFINSKLFGPLYREPNLVFVTVLVIAMLVSFSAISFGASTFLTTISVACMVIGFMLILLLSLYAYANHNHMKDVRHVNALYGQYVDKYRYINVFKHFAPKEYESYSIQQYYLKCICPRELA